MEIPPPPPTLHKDFSLVSVCNCNIYVIYGWHFTSEQFTPPPFTNITLIKCPVILTRVFIMHENSLFPLSKVIALKCSIILTQAFRIRVAARTPYQITNLSKQSYKIYKIQKHKNWIIFKQLYKIVESFEPKIPS